MVSVFSLHHQFANIGISCLLQEESIHHESLEAILNKFYKILFGAWGVERVRYQRKFFFFYLTHPTVHHFVT